MSSETINADQCADLLGCNTETVEELCRKGDLPGVKFGRGWIFVKADLLDYIAEKGRRDAEERRQGFQGRRQMPAAVLPVKPRRQTPPVLPVPPRAIAAGPGPRL